MRSLGVSTPTPLLRAVLRHERGAGYVEPAPSLFRVV
jgi:hypothetical protein